MKVYFLFFAIVLFFALRLLSRVLRTIPAKPTMHNFYLRLFPVFEFTIWIAFGLWAFREVFGEYPYYNLIVSVALALIILAIGWFFLRDFIAGIVLKTETPFEIKQYIKTSSLEGKISKLGSRSLEIETDSGQRVKVPYGQLASNAINLQSLDNTIQGFETTIKVDASLPLQAAKENIVNQILMLPWSAINKEPSVNLVEQNNKINTFQVLFYSISSRHAAYIRQHLKNTFERLETTND